MPRPLILLELQWKWWREQLAAVRCTGYFSGPGVSTGDPEISMRRLVLSLLGSSALSVGLGQPGSAAEAGPGWTGFYVGAHAGYRWVDETLTANPFSFERRPGRPFNIPARSEAFSRDGAIFGLQGGYNYRFAPTWLLGIEADISWGRNSTTHSFSTTDGFTTLTLTRTSTFRLGPQGSVRGRFGSVNGPWLIYGTGGASFVSAEWAESWSPIIPLVSPPVPFAVSSSKTLTGWTLGFGVEHMFAPRWLVRLEYLYTDYGSFSVPLALTTNSGNFNVTTQVLRGGVSYQFVPFIR
jgi:outer membrane immunogenic protein